MDECPFLYCINPVKNGLLVCELVKKIRMKFKSMQVKALEIEMFIQRSLLKYVNLV